MMPAKTQAALHVEMARKFGLQLICMYCVFFLKLIQTGQLVKLFTYLSGESDQAQAREPAYPFEEEFQVVYTFANFNSNQLVLQFS